MVMLIRIYDLPKAAKRFIAVNLPGSQWQMHEQNAQIVYY